MLFSLLSCQPSLRAENHYSSTQNQNNELTNSLSLNLNRLFFLEKKMSQSVFSALVVQIIGHSNRDKRYWKRSKFQIIFYTFIFTTVFKTDKSLKMLLRQKKVLDLNVKRVELYNQRAMNYNHGNELLLIFISLLIVSLYFCIAIIRQ